MIRDTFSVVKQRNVEEETEPWEIQIKWCKRQAAKKKKRDLWKMIKLAQAESISERISNVMLTFNLDDDTVQ